ncbi:NAD(P)-dependent oxidoreductase [Algoriphagus sp. CAU 1675]|uniref:NAD-dependent epimerase/dehydratase family protein n=1 Tax=Algoriphagus sp. CAU 1675 TaxID=3032597 RepID=UPI0023DC0F35|nr:NAD(P)-dependent oxidoreductase [Algoriphagus sp. CAU 1675]MDF2158194.1 NAD(P)-dependent oxidoreductase [Algoriphagus sp. CAU 1675]
MKVAITGSSGYLGSFLVPFLMSNNIDVFEISRNKGYNLLDLNSTKSIDKFDVLIHLASRTYVPDSFKNPNEFYEFNLLGTINALELARKYSAKVINVSSYLYGEPQYLPVDENHNLNPHNPYANSKYISEKLCKAYSSDFGIKVVNLRLFNLFGPNQPTNFLIPTIISQLKSKSITLKDPRPKRDFLYISDFLNLIYKVLLSSFKNNQFEILNVGSGISYSVSQIVDTILKCYNVDCEIKYLNEYRDNEVLDCYADIRKAYALYEWEPNISLAEGINKIRYYL